MAGLGVGVPAHLVGLGLAQRGLRDEGPQPGVLGLVRQDRALLVGDRELGPQALEAVAHVDEPALEQGLVMEPPVYGAAARTMADVEWVR